MVVLRAKETPDCGVSITDNTAPGTLIMLPPCVLRAHNQVRGRRSGQHYTSPQGKPGPASFPPHTCDADTSDAEKVPKWRSGEGDAHHRWTARPPPGLTAFKGELGPTSGHWARSQDIRTWVLTDPSSIRHTSSGDMPTLTWREERGLN